MNKRAHKNSNKCIKKLLRHILTICIKHYFVSYCPPNTHFPKPNSTFITNRTVITNFRTNCNANFLYLIFYLLIKKKNSHLPPRAINATCKTYSTSDNETPPISRVLIGRHVIFCWLTSTLGCNSPRKYTSVKYMKRQKAGFPIVT